MPPGTDNPAPTRRQGRVARRPHHVRGPGPKLPGVNWLSPVELVGYAASALVVASLAMTNVVRLRSISLVGSVTFVVYGLLLGSVPIIVTNAAVAVLNIWFLRKELGGGRALGTTPIDPQAPFFADFIGSHLEDIRRSQPEFTGSAPADLALVLTRDGLPAGALVGRRVGEQLELTLDYVMAAYRDSHIGTWLYGPGAKVLRGAGVEQVVATPTTAVHRTYLLGVGFRDVGGGRLVRDLS